MRKTIFPLIHILTNVFFSLFFMWLKKKSCSIWFKNDFGKQSQPSGHAVLDHTPDVCRWRRSHWPHLWWDESTHRSNTVCLVFWCSANKLDFSALKTVETIVDFRKDPTPPLPPHLSDLCWVEENKNEDVALLCYYWAKITLVDQISGKYSLNKVSLLQQNH